MASAKYPQFVATGIRMNEETSPDLLTEEERVEWATRISIISAEAIGGAPKNREE